MPKNSDQHNLHAVAPGAAASPTLKEAVRLHQAGHLGRAEALYREAIAAVPDDADALHLLGVLCHQKGQSALGANAS